MDFSLLTLLTIIGTHAVPLLIAEYCFVTEINMFYIYTVYADSFLSFAFELEGRGLILWDLQTMYRAAARDVYVIGWF
jgi:hypothetical protein